MSKKAMVSRGGVLLGVLLLTSGLLLTGCGGEIDEATVTELTGSGYSAESAAELSRLDLSEGELEQLEIAKRGGLDDVAAAKIVKTLHDRELAFDIGMEMQTLSGAGFSSTALVELVEIESVRRWESDLRVMKHAGISEPTILMIARRKFVDEEEDVLSGRDYERLKTSGISDAGLEEFVKNGGTPQQLQQVEMAIRKGTSEQAALREVGF